MGRAARIGFAVTVLALMIAWLPRAVAESPPEAAIRVQSGEKAAREATLSKAGAEHLRRLNELEWVPAKGYPSGVMQALVHADSRVGIAYLKLPAGTHVAAHTHPGDHWGTVVSGNCTFSLSSDLSAGSELGPGDFAFIPAGRPHRFTARTELIIAGSAIGRHGIDYLDAADDPRAEETHEH